MADVCSVVSSYVTLMMCIQAPTCEAERPDGKVLCKHPGIRIERSVANEAVVRLDPVQSCNRTITNYCCTRPDGSEYDYQE